MADENTLNYGWKKPENGASADTWGIKWNQNADDMDSDLKAVENKADACLIKSQNLSDLANKPAACSNLGAQPLHAILTSLAASGGTANATPYFSASNTISLKATTSFGRDLWNVADAAAGRAALGMPVLGTAATKNITVSGSGPSGGAAGDVWIQI